MSQQALQDLNRNWRTTEIVIYIYVIYENINIILSVNRTLKPRYIEIWSLIQNLLPQGGNGSNNSFDHDIYCELLMFQGHQQCLALNIITLFFQCDIPLVLLIWLHYSHKTTKIKTKICFNCMHLLSAFMYRKNVMNSLYIFLTRHILHKSKLLLSWIQLRCTRAQLPDNVTIDFHNGGTYCDVSTLNPYCCTCKEKNLKQGVMGGLAACFLY